MSLDVDDQVVADLRNDIPECLRENNIQHGLKVCHTDGFCSFGLSRIDR